MKYNKYRSEITKLTSNFDQETIGEIDQILIRSISDLNLENSSFEEKQKQLGTPSEFVNEYIQETDIKRPFHERMFEDTLYKREFSYKATKVLQVVAILLVPIFSLPNPPRADDFNVWVIPSFYLLFGLVFYISFKIGLQIEKRVNDFMRFFYRSFVILSLAILFNIVIDDFIIGFDQYLYYKMNSFYLNGIGMFIIWVFPIAILSGLKYVIHSIEQNTNMKIEIQGLAEESNIPRYKALRNITIPFLYFWVFADREIGFLLFSIGVILMFGIIDIYENRKGKLEVIIRNHSISIILLIVYYFLIIGFDELIWGGFN